MAVLRLTLSLKQRQFAEALTRHNWLIGPKGEGKTYGLVCRMFAHAGRQEPRNLPIRVAFIRDTHENFQAHTVTAIKRNFPNVFTFRNDFHIVHGPDVEGQSFGVNDLEAVNKLQGGEFDMALIDEPAPILESGNAGIREEVYSFADASLRGGHCTKSIDVSMNPANRHHWTYKRAITAPAASSSVFFMLPGENPYYSREDRAAMEETFRSRPDLYARYVKGEFADVFAGVAVTPEFKERRHVADHKLDPVAGSHGFRFWDGGMNAAVALCQVTPSGYFQVLDSLMMENDGMHQLISTRVIPLLSTPRYGDKIKTWRDIGDASLANREGSNSEHRASAIINELLHTAFEQGVQEWADRREAFRIVLEKGLGGEAYFQVSPHVTFGEPFNRVIAGLSGGWAYPVGTDGQPKRDKAIKDRHSHLCDALSHGLAKLFIRPHKKYEKPDPKEASKLGRSYSV